MKLLAPAYYTQFRCIADRCRHSCCIGWEIDIDEETAESYRNLTADYGSAIRESVDFAADPPHFRLREEERCPHLDERGLCKIITCLGEDHLCRICKEHPRFYHDTARGREVGIGMACEEACRLILSSDQYRIFSEIGECEGETPISDFDPLLHRERIYGVLSDASIPYGTRLCRIGEAYGLSLSSLSDEEWREILASLEYLNPGHSSLFACFTADPAPVPFAEKMLERVLAYFVFRYCSEAEDEDDFRASLGFCLFCERLLASVLAETPQPSPEEICEAARIISEEIEYSEDNVEAIRFECSLLGE